MVPSHSGLSKMSNIKLSRSELSAADSIDFRIRMFINDNPDKFKDVANLNSVDEIANLIERASQAEFEGEDVRDASLRIANECLELKKDPGSYLLDADGKPLFKLTKDMIYTPPPQKLDDGTIIQASPKLHPKITTGLALLAHEKSKLNSLQKMLPNSEPIKHLLEPWSIIEEASKILSRPGDPEVANSEEECTSEEYIEVGAENTNSVFQSLNSSFIRYKAFGAALAHKIRELGAYKYLISNIERSQDSKTTWFEITVKYSRLS